jgi:hypothetical protein
MIILSLCDLSGVWSKPYVELGYRVIRVDPKLDPFYVQTRHISTAVDMSVRYTKMVDGGFALPVTVQTLLANLRINPTWLGDQVHGILMAPPCTDFAGLGARWWPEKDVDGRTATSVKLVESCLTIKKILLPRFWALENPVGRLKRLVPGVGKTRMTFDPCEYAGWADEPSEDAYTKRTCLWGNFSTKLEKRPIKPIMYTCGDKQGSWMWAFCGGKSEETKDLRSITPSGFARAFARANP